MTQDELKEWLKENFAAYCRAKMAGNYEEAARLVQAAADKAAEAIGVEAAINFFNDKNRCELKEEFTEYAQNNRLH